MNNRRAFWFSACALFIFLVCIVALGNYARLHPPKISLPNNSVQPGYYKVIEFHDGDTISISMEGASEKIRMIGVDTPETQDPRKPVQCFGKAASQFTKDLIGNNAVRLEADDLSSNRDRYDRLLRYVYIPDGRMINQELIAQGYGFAYTSFPFTRSEEFKQAENEARTNNRGLWASCQPSQNDYGGFTSNNAN